MDSDSTDKRDMLCQCFVEVVTESESKSQGVSENSTKVTDVILSLLTILFLNAAVFYLHDCIHGIRFKIKLEEDRG